MSSAQHPPRPPLAWIVFAHLAGAILLGSIEALRIGSLWLGLATVPLFAAVGLLTGLAVGGAELIARGRPWWLAAIAIASPSLIITFAMASTLFDGAFAQTLPLAGALPVLAPLVLWVPVAIAVAVGRRVLRSGDLVSRAIGVVVVGGAIGLLLRVKVQFVGMAYPGVHAAITITAIVLVGIAVRITRRRDLPAYLAAGLATITLGTTLGAVGYGLREDADRQRLARVGNATKDLVRVWRGVLDRDGDGSSGVLGGGDCDDGDAARFPGARDEPGDGIDQDCDGRDAIRPVAPPPPPVEATHWRDAPEVAALLARTRGMSVLVISVDALRADLLAPEAVHRADFPNLVKLLDESVWFTRAIAPAAGTDISISTLLSGRADPFQPIETTLIEAMRASGRRTYAAIPDEVTRYVGDVMIDRGVDTPKRVHTDWQVRDIGDHVSAPVTTLEGLRALDDAQDRPAFVWLHYFDVHEHHQIKLAKSQLEAVHDTGPGPKSHGYRALLAQIDGELGKLRAELATRGRADKTIIVFASDHGESLGEDSRLGETHGRVTYAALTRIPLAIHVPGLPGGQRLDPVSLVDLAPTLLGLIGTPTAMAQLDGIDLLPAMLDLERTRDPARVLVIHEEWQWSVVEWPYQLIVRLGENLEELYDLERDPLQRSDLSVTRPDLVQRLRARYAEVPAVHVDRTPAGRQWRESQARPQATRVPPPRSSGKSTR